MSNQNEQISPPMESIASVSEDESKETMQRVPDLTRPKKKAKWRKSRKKLPTQEEIAALNQQAAIMRKYLRAKRRWEEAFRGITDTLDKVWNDMLTKEYVPCQTQWTIWLSRYSPDEVQEAIQIAAIKYNAGHFGSYEWKAVRELIRYVSGILKRRREQQACGLCPYCGNPV